MAKKKQSDTVPKKRRTAEGSTDAVAPPSSSKRAGRPGKDKRPGTKGTEVVGGVGVGKPGKAKKKRQTGAGGELVELRPPEPRVTQRAPTSPPRSLGDVDGFLAVVEAIPDPERRYEVATVALGEHVQAIERLSSVRADAVAALYLEGGSVRSLAQRLGVSPSRVHQLIHEAHARASAPAGR